MSGDIRYDPTFVRQHSKMDSQRPYELPLFASRQNPMDTVVIPVDATFAYLRDSKVQWPARQLAAWLAHHSEFRKEIESTFKLDLPTAFGLVLENRFTSSVELLAPQVVDLEPFRSAIIALHAEVQQWSGASGFAARMHMNHVVCRLKRI